ncbi:site-specific integrase [uncultured Aquimarina sp.]|uniref:tyrosine-type recombinase/integrase n=1 Tax=uncultured Aquimarina sp. TaxID=575652 RepID=UPI0026030D68|nr:site-specific integrase [uncultured Aquimarina sp.]
MSYSISIFHDTRRPKKNGLCPVKLRVYATNLKKVKLYPLNIDLSDKDFKKIWESNTKVRGKNEDTRIELRAIENRANDESRKISFFNFEDFERKMFRKSTDGNNVFYHFDKEIKRNIRRKKVNTADGYKYTLKSLKDFLLITDGSVGDRFPFSMITPRWLEDYEEYMLDKGKSVTTIAIYLRNLRVVFNHAIDDGDINRDIYPFGQKKFQISESGKVKKALNQQQLSTFFKAKPKTPEQKKAKDFWFFSFACNGMNMKDIALLKYSDFDGNSFHYYRAKTFQKSKRKTKINIYLNDFSKSIIKKYGNKSKSGYVFPILEEGMSAVDVTKHIKNFNRFINQHIKKIAKKNKLPEDISFYWARHSFATNAIRKGASMEFISEALNHSGLDVTKGYFAGFEDETKKEFAQNLMDF